MLYYNIIPLIFLDVDRNCTDDHLAQCPLLGLGIPLQVTTPNIMIKKCLLLQANHKNSLNIIIVVVNLYMVLQNMDL